MKRNILIAYYSRSGNTQTIAQLIHQELEGTLFEIIPENPYPTDYNTVVNQAKKEIRDRYLPPLKTTITNGLVYDMVFVGSPNWWSTLAPPVATFLTNIDLSGKTVVPFCTHGGGGQAEVLRNITKLCPDSSVLDGIAIYGNGGNSVKTDVSKWLNNTGIL